jgi:hypothetical protein
MIKPRGSALLTQQFAIKPPSCVAHFTSSQTVLLPQQNSKRISFVPDAAEDVAHHKSVYLSIMTIAEHGKATLV